MKKHIIILAITFSVSTANLLAQISDVRSFYIKAFEEYQKKEYTSALTNLQKAEQAAGKTNEYIESLKALCYFETKDIAKCEQSLKAFYSYSCSNASLNNQMSELVIKLQKYQQDQRIKEIKDEIDLAKSEGDVVTSTLVLVQSKIAERNAIIQASIDYKNELEADVNVLSHLEEGRIYVFKPSSRLSDSKIEESYFVFYGDKYMIFTIPVSQVVRELNKNTVSFSTYDAQRYSEYVTNLKVKTNSGKKEYNFHKVPHYSNVFIGGGGDDLLWHGQQYTTFNQNLYYYNYGGYLGVDIEMYTDFKSGYYNPYIEVGRISKTIDYRIVSDSAISNQLVNLNVIDNVNSGKLKISMRANSRKMIFPEKHITYTLMDQNVEGSYTGGNYNYKKAFLYFTPQTSTTHYGFIEFTGGFYSYNLLNDLILTEKRVIIDVNSFNLVYSSFEESYGDGEMKYFIEPSYTLVYDLMIQSLNAYSINRQALKDVYRK